MKILSSELKVNGIWITERKLILNVEISSKVSNPGERMLDQIELPCTKLDILYWFWCFQNQSHSEKKKQATWWIFIESLQPFPFFPVFSKIRCFHTEYAKDSWILHRFNIKMYWLICFEMHFHSVFQCLYPEMLHFKPSEQLSYMSN